MATSRARRANAGNRMSSLMGTELEKDEMFAEEENDQEFVDKGEQDVFDADFNDTDSDDDQGMEEAAREVDDAKTTAKRKRIDFLQKRSAPAKKAPTVAPATAADSNVTTAKAEIPPAKRKAPKRKDWMQFATPRRSHRESTVQKKEELQIKIKERTKKESKRKKVLRRVEVPLTQEQLLAEAAVTEELNRASLERWKTQEIERKERARRNPLAHVIQGPIIRWQSSLKSASEDDSNQSADPRASDVFVPAAVHPDARNLLIFDGFPETASIFASFENTQQEAPSYLQDPVCPYSAGDAKYLDPVTQTPYSSASALVFLRGLLESKSLLLWSKVRHAWQGTAPDDDASHFRSLGTLVKVVDADEQAAQLSRKAAASHRRSDQTPIAMDLSVPITIPDSPEPRAKTVVDATYEEAMPSEDSHVPKQRSKRQTRAGAAQMPPTFSPSRTTPDLVDSTVSPQPPVLNIGANASATVSPSSVAAISPSATRQTGASKDNTAVLPPKAPSSDLRALLGMTKSEPPAKKPLGLATVPTMASHNQPRVLPRPRPPPATAAAYGVIPRPSQSNASSTATGPRPSSTHIPKAPSAAASPAAASPATPQPRPPVPSFMLSSQAYMSMMYQQMAAAQQTSSSSATASSVAAGSPVGPAHYPYSAFPGAAMPQFFGQSNAPMPYFYGMMRPPMAGGARPQLQPLPNPSTSPTPGRSNSGTAAASQQGSQKPS
ncbi:Vacuolar protein sorting-associated protein 72 [Sorochytrium milnesiophthora]